jgi:hypothetical protein
MVSVSEGPPETGLRVAVSSEVEQHGGVTFPDPDKNSLNDLIVMTADLLETCGAIHCRQSIIFLLDSLSLVSNLINISHTWPEILYIEP